MQKHGRITRVGLIYSDFLKREIPKGLTLYKLRGVFYWKENLGVYINSSKRVLVLFTNESGEITPATNYIIVDKLISSGIYVYKAPEVEEYPTEVDKEKPTINAATIEKLQALTKRCAILEHKLSSIKTIATADDKEPDQDSNKILAALSHIERPPLSLVA